VGSQVENEGIAGQFVAYTREMIESPAYRALSLQGRKILRRLEIEHMAHGGAENGRLPSRYYLSEIRLPEKGHYPSPGKTTLSG
jgi:hypothetical protein